MKLQDKSRRLEDELSTPDSNLKLVRVARSPFRAESPAEKQMNNRPLAAALAVSSADDSGQWRRSFCREMGREVPFEIAHRGVWLEKNSGDAAQDR